MPDVPRSADVVVRAAGRACGLPAAQVVRVLPWPDVAPMPGQGAPFLGVAGIGEQIVPVIDLGVVLGGAPPAAVPAGEVVVVRHGGHLYALRVDAVVRVHSARRETLNAEAPRRIDLGAVLDGLPAPGAPGTVTGAVPPATSARPATPGRRQGDDATHAALVVHTAASAHRVAWSAVRAVVGELAVAAVPGSDASVAGVAVHGARAIPVVRLDRLLGEAVAAPPQDPARVHAIVAVDGVEVALAVQRIGALVASAGPQATLALPRLLASFVAAHRSGDGAGVSRPALRPPAARASRHLVFTVDAQAFALAMDEVERVQLGAACVAFRSAGTGLCALVTVRDRVLPVLDTRVVLGVGDPTCAASAHVVVRDPVCASFAVPADASMRMAWLAPSDLRRMAPGSAVLALTRLDGEAVRVLSAPSLALAAGWRHDGA